ncbi:hypothetical protein O4J56_31150 [Nocardiopsis sp. RSe5-2]|uniref:Peptidase inhibitor family I36 n=1 Tax=Nocardiopsis endophytica TaxID=3018445 RepID=A0ABT4UDS3_9ACTN|nr:hypothetical protein [Nocardiopsis endophytica]MDA2815140.1 hypothetical protein [Nocardiopsis endophytica]
MKRTLPRAAVGGAVLLLGATLTSGTAAAEEGEHCVADMDTGEQECFATLDAALAAAEEGTAPSGLTTLSAEADARNDVIVGTFFTERDYGGDSLTVTAEAPCVKNGVMDYEFDLTGEFAPLANDISSVQPWADCWIWLYPEVGLGGDRDGPYKENTGYVGDFMNDRADSIGFS